MEVAGRSSWRFAESDRDHLAHVALFVRDALALPVPRGPAVPPPLTGAVPDLRHVLSEQERRDAGTDWAGWWADVLDLAGQAQDASLSAERERVGAPPEFTALDDRPALHRAAVTAFPEAHAWVSRHHRGPRADRRGSFDHNAVRSVAEDVAVTERVDVGELRGNVVVLGVEGRWSHLLAPGTVACSRGTAGEPVQAEHVLRRAFVSGLQR